MSVRAAALWSMGGQYVVFALQFAISVVLSRWFLTPADVGIFSIGFAAAGMIALMQDFGLNRYIVAAAGIDARHLRACLTVSMIAGAGVALAIVAIAWPVSIFYHDRRLVPVLALIGGSFLLLPMNTVPIALLQREMRFRETALVNLAAAIANGLVTMAMAMLGYAAFALACGVLAQQAARGLLAQMLCPVRLDYRPLFEGLGPLVRFGSNTTALAVSGAIGGKSPELIIGRALGLGAVGLFGRAASVADQLRQLLDGAVSAVFYAQFARLRNSGAALGEPYRRMMACYTGAVWPPMLLLAVIAEPLVVAVYGQRWGGVAIALRWIALGELIFVAMPLHTEMPLLAGRFSGLLWRNALDTAAAVVALLVGVRFGLAGAAQSRLAYGVVWYAIYAGFIRDIVGFRWHAMTATYVASGAAALAMVAPSLLLLWRAAIPSFGALVVAGAAGAPLWLAALFATRHPLAAEVRDIVPGLFRRARQRLAWGGGR